MLFTIPILVEEHVESDTHLKSFIVRPLFHTEPVQRGDKLSRVLRKLTEDLQERLLLLGREPRHDALAEWCFNPPIEETSLDLRLELSSGSHKGRWFFTGYPALNRKLYFTPLVQDLHFEVLVGQSLIDRATAVLTRHFRDREKEHPLDLEALVGTGRMRLTALEISLHPATLAKAAAKPTRALIFGGTERKDGEQELRKTGRALQSFYPDDLDRAVQREREVADLASIFAGADRRPVVLVGPRKVGKTAIVHELVWRMNARKQERFGGGREVWLVSPMRLISGMSCLGEWENRVLAILDHMQAKDQVLYFDDLLGLFTAGISSASDLSVAHVLKPALEKRRVRVLAEITPEAWRVLRERDRGFADLFHVIPATETTEAQTFHILVSVARQLEDQHRCEFALNAVPKVYDLQRRFGGDAAFPGKAAGFLKRLAVRFVGSAITETQVLTEFQEQTGLHPAFLGSDLSHGSRRNGATRQARGCILNDLKRTVVGQDHALDAFADVLVKFQARLQDPRRPLGTFLLLGPTGVGKTQAAKSLAAYLFSHEDRLLRFDMNEYVDAAAAPRLTGTPSDPEGLLTSAIRRQPFSVVLFDEIEKAAPEVFDLLLAVLDEGRLTDALGRVADFTHSIIVLTSNLGSREARSQLGFHAGTATEQDAVYVAAAEKFFRPEFFNRLDRVIPFHSLAPAELEGIARKLVGGVFAREGMRRRECLLNVTPEAINQLVTLGHHPQLGARALKRAVEREIAQPLATQLAVRSVGPPIVATVDATAGKLALRLAELNPIPRSVFWGDQITAVRSEMAQRAWIKAVLDGTKRFLERVDASLEASALSGRIEVGKVRPEQTHYFTCREQWRTVKQVAEAAALSLGSPLRESPIPRLPNPRPSEVATRSYSRSPRRYRESEASTLRVELGALQSDETIDLPDSPVANLFREAALLEVLIATPIDDRPCVLMVRNMISDDGSELTQVAYIYQEAVISLSCDDAVEYPFRALTGGQTIALWCQGLNLRRLLPIGTNTVVVRGPGIVRTLALCLLEADSKPQAEKEILQLANRSAGAADPDTVGPVIHMIDASRRLTDFRSGLVFPRNCSREEARAFLLSALPLPPELNF